MLCLLFQLGDALCAVEAARIAEVLALSHMKPFASSANEVAGEVVFHGDAVPVVDLSRLHLGRASRSRLSTRVFVFDPEPESSPTRMLGMIAERANEALPFEPADFTESSPLGRTGQTPRGAVQWVDLNRLVPANARERAWASKAAQPAATGTGTN